MDDVDHEMRPLVEVEGRALEMELWIIGIAAKRVDSSLLMGINSKRVGLGLLSPSCVLWCAEGCFKFD